MQDESLLRSIPAAARLAIYTQKETLQLIPSRLLQQPLRRTHSLPHSPELQHRRPLCEYTCQHPVTGGCRLSSGAFDWQQKYCLAGIKAPTKKIVMVVVGCCQDHRLPYIYSESVQQLISKERIARHTAF